MLTEKNINTTTYRQSDNAGSIQFSEDYYESANVHDENNPAYTIVEGYVSYFNNNIDLKTPVTGGIINALQSNNLNGKGYTWLNYSTWTGLATDRYGNIQFFAQLAGPEYGGVTGSVLFNSEERYVRPVITISVDDLK